MESAYIKTTLVYSESGLQTEVYNELKPTGRWKVMNDDKHTVAIEHKDGWFSKRWVYEDSVVFKPVYTSTINVCH